MRNLLFTAALLTLSASGTLYAQTPAEAAVLSVPLEAAPVRLAPLPHEPREAHLAEAGAPADRGLSVKFYALNESVKAIRSLDVGAYVYSAEGVARGFHIFSFKVDIAPGTSRYFDFRTAAFEREPGDTVVLVPEWVSGTELSWARPAEITPHLLEIARQETLFERQITVDIKCESKCDARGDTCSGICDPCGVSEFSCSCGDNATITSTCKCHKCSGGVGGPV